MTANPDRSFDRRTFLGHSLRAAAGMALLGTAGSSLLSACSTTSHPSSSALTHYNGIGGGKPRSGGSLTFGAQAEEPGFDPFTASWDTTGILYARTVFDPLAIVAADGSIQPYLAESITPNADYTVWTITARPGVTFHDGTPFDGAAIALNIEAYHDSLITGFAYDPPLASAHQSGPLSAEVVMSQPWVPFDAYLAGGIGGNIAYMVSPRVIKSSSLNTHPVGTGPFVFVDWVPNDHFTARRNPSYWRTGLPYLDEITYRPIPSDAARLDSIESGAIQIMHTESAELILDLRAKSGYGYIDDLHNTHGEPSMDFAMLNLGAPPFDDPIARQALAYATDSARWRKVIERGVNPESTGPFAPGSPFYTSTGFPTYDPAKARSLVAEYERKHHQPLSFAYGDTTGTSSAVDCEFLQSMWESVGMKVTIKQTEQDSYISNAENGTYQANEWTQFAAVDPDLNYIFWSPTKSAKVGSFATNFARNTDPRVQTYLEEGRTNPDPAARATAYQELSKRFAVDLPYIWLDRSVWAIGALPHVKNWNGPTTPSGMPALGMSTGYLWPTQIWMDS